MGGNEIRVTFSLSLVGSMINFPFKICKDNAVTAEFKQMGDNFYSGALLCGEFRPPLPEYPKYIHFHTVFYMGESIKVIPSDSVIILNRSDVNQTLHIIEPPVPIPLPDSMNPTLTALDDFCSAHLFFKEQNDTDQLLYLSSISEKWKNFFPLISKILIDNGRSLFNIHVTVITSNDCDDVCVPPPSPAGTFFTNRFSFRNGRQAMIIVISSDATLDLKIGDSIYPTSNIPTIPKNVAKIAAVKMRSNQLDFDLARLLRRLLIVSINGGVAVDLLQKCRLKMEAVELKPENFSRVVLHLNNSSIDDNEIKTKLQIPLGNLFHYLDTHSNEASYCGLFWNQILNILFRYDETPTHSSNHRLCQEWNTQLLYKDKSITSRRIDLVSLIEFDSVYYFTPPESPSPIDVPSSPTIATSTKRKKVADSISIPILTVEAGRFGFSKENMHKDFGKTLGLISANCITLAHHLVAIGKKPEAAVVYGILIGGTSILICTAHAVVTKLSDNSYEIHANVTFDDHWFINVITPPPSSSASIVSDPQQSCILPCCHSTQLPGLESIQPASNPIDLNVVNIPESFSLEIPAEEETATRQLENPILSSFKSWTLNWTCIRRMKALVDCVKARINMIKSMSDDIIDKSGRKFTNPGGKFYFSQANQTDIKGNILETPQDSKPAEYSSKKLQSLSKNLFAAKKSSRLELAIYTECAAYFPSIFPRIYGIQESEDLSLRYDFEKMLPFQSQLVDWVRKEHTMFPFLKFALDCLFELHILHELIGVIHRDISPANIMFSEVDGVFKIFDFDLSIRKGDPSNNPSPGIGTKDFIAPESERFGVYNEASDVYSLGMVMFSTLIPLLDQMDISEDHSTKFICTVAGMIIADVKGRLSVIKAIEEFMALFCTLSSPGSEDNLESTRQRCQLLLLSKETSASLVKKPEPVPEPVHLKTLHPAETIEKEIPSATSEIPSIEPKSHEIQGKFSIG